MTQSRSGRFGEEKNLFTLSGVDFLFVQFVVQSLYSLQYMIFKYCNWVSTRWQWSGNSYIDSKETAIYKRRDDTQNKRKTDIERCKSSN